MKHQLVLRNVPLLKPLVQALLIGHQALLVPNLEEIWLIIAFLHNLRVFDFKKDWTKLMF